VADRFHLIQNLRQAVQSELTCHRAHLRIPIEEFAAPSEKKVAPVAFVRPRRVRCKAQLDELKGQRWQHKLEQFQLVKNLSAQGSKVIDVMRQAGISRGLADKWLRLAEWPPRAKRTSGPGMAKDFREELWRRWEQGQQEGKQLLAEIRPLGYVGSYASLMRFLTPWRAAQQASRQARETPQPVKLVHPGAARHISPRVAAALLSKPKPQLNGRQSETVEILKRRCPGFAAMRHLVLSLSWHPVQRESGQPAELGEESGSGRHRLDQHVCAAIKAGHDSSGRGCRAGLEQRPCGGSDQPAEEPQETNVWSSQIRVTKSAHATVSGLNPPAPNPRNNHL
jgi:hypothetical protein